MLRHCLAIRAAKESDRWQYFETQRGIGAALLGQKQYAQAETQLVQAYQGLKEREASMSNNNKHYLTEGLQQIVRLYEEWGKPEEVAKWRKELDERLARETPAANSSEKP